MSKGRALIGLAWSHDFQTFFLVTRGLWSYDWTDLSLGWCPEIDSSIRTMAVGMVWRETLTNPPLQKDRFLSINALFWKKGLRNNLAQCFPYLDELVKIQILRHHPKL